MDKNFNIGHNSKSLRGRASIFHVFFLCQDLSHGTIIFDLLALNLDLLLKNFYIGHILNTIRGRAFIFHMCIPYDKTFHMVPQFLTL